MLVFIDESGDHNLDITKSDNTYNVFILSAVLIDEEKYKVFDQRLKEIEYQIVKKEMTEEDLLIFP